MKNNEASGDFNKIIIDGGDGAQSDNEKAAAAVNADNTAVPAPQPDDNAALQPPAGAQSASDKPASMPPVKPTTIVLTVLFALLFALGYFFLPYLTQYLPVGGQSVTLNAGIVPADHGFLVKNAVSVVIGRSEKTKVTVSDNTYADGMPLVYTEHTFKVDRVLFGNPVMENGEYLVTYSLGGTVISRDSMNRPQRVTFRYADAAELKDTVLLFLDDQNNIISEKYGLYRRHNDELFYDNAGVLYSAEQLAKEFEARKEAQPAEK